MLVVITPSEVALLMVGGFGVKGYVRHHWVLTCFFKFILGVSLGGFWQIRTEGLFQQLPTNKAVCFVLSVRPGSHLKDFRCLGYS